MLNICSIAAHYTEWGDIMELLRNLFAREVDFDNGFELFGTQHIMLSLIFFALYAAVIVFRVKLREFGHFMTIRRIMAGLLFANMLIHYSGRIIIGEWHFSEDLPLHICFVANFFMMYILITDNKRSLFSVIYYFTMIGPLPAIILPDLSRSQSGYLFWQFIISHHVMMLFSLYCAFVLEYETSLKDACRAFLYGNAYVAVMAVFNGAFGTNYIMLGELPEQLYEKFPFLYALPAFVWLELAGMAAIAAAYGVWAANEKRPTLEHRARNAHIR